MPTILIVEDNELSRDMLSRRLLKRGYRVETAVDGASAIAAASANAPDLILMDLRLPDMSGRDVTHALRASEKTRRICIIALTAHAMEGDREQAIKSGCDDYDTKPVDLPRLLEKIQHLLGKAPER